MVPISVLTFQGLANTFTSLHPSFPKEKYKKCIIDVTAFVIVLALVCHTRKTEQSFLCAPKQTVSLLMEYEYIEYLCISLGQVNLNASTKETLGKTRKVE